LLTPAVDHEGRKAAAKEWIEHDPTAAARVAVGLMRDDQTGTTLYEDSFIHQTTLVFEHNPGSEKNLFNRLNKLAQSSKLIKKQSEELSEDEKNAILKTLYEGGERSHTQIHTSKEGNSDKTAGSAATSFNGIYDRLGAGNVRGYSAQLMSLQSSLNARRPPGIPPLVETGKIDYQTLIFPAHAMAYDIVNLDERLKREMWRWLEHRAHRPLTAQEQSDPDIEAKILRQFPGDKPSRLTTRGAHVLRARSALASFRLAADQARNPQGITRELIIELGQKQKAAARWITAAALEEDLTRIDEAEGFLTPQLLATIQSVAITPTIREAYTRQGHELKSRLARNKSDSQEALALLTSDIWSRELDHIDRLMSHSRALKGSIFRDIDDYSRIPYRLVDKEDLRPRWRKWLEEFALQYAPRTQYSRSLARARKRKEILCEIFRTIASGNFPAAHDAINREIGI
jgi:hypothetical protein